MPRLSICRMCLSSNTDYKVADKRLQEIYEKLNTIPFKTSDMRPLALCYICHAQLKAARRLMLKCQKAEEFLSEMLIELTTSKNSESMVTVLDCSMLKQFCFTEIQQISIDGEEADDNVDVKMEDDISLSGTEDIKIKEEILQDSQEATDCDIEFKTEEFQSESDDDETLSDIKNVKTEKKTARGPQKKKPIGKKKQNARTTQIKNDSTNHIGYPNTDSDSQSRSDFPQDKFYCGICRKCFVTKHALLYHRLTHVNDKKLYYCELCNKGFTVKQNLARHTLTHTGEKPYVCNICNKHFNQSDTLKTHMHTHTDSKPYQCEICGRCYKNKNDLLIHERSHTGNGKVYACEICNKVFTQKCSLISHIRIHTGEKPYECDVCHKRFVRKFYLDTHKRVHTGETPYVCNICNKTFSQNNTLCAHSIVHTGRKPFICDVCKKPFNYKVNLKRHLLIHTGERPFACKFCEKCFNQKSTLTVHTRIHTGEKPFECCVCYKRFTEKRSLKNHQIIFGHLKYS